MELETEQNYNILTSTLMTITAFLSRSPGLLNRGPGGPASLGHVPHFSIFSPSATAQLSAGSLYHILPPTDSNFLCTELYYCFMPAQFNLSIVKVIPLTPSTGCTCYLHRCIFFFDSSAGVNMQHFLLSNPFRKGMNPLLLQNMS